MARQELLRWGMMGSDLGPMEYRRQSKGLRTFFEFWVLASPGALLLLGLATILAPMQLIAISPVTTFVVSIVPMVCGALLILRAKWPVYQSRTFFSFGAKSVPQHLRAHYRWGWWTLLMGASLAVLLLMAAFAP